MGQFNSMLMHVYVMESHVNPCLRLRFQPSDCIFPIFRSIFIGCEHNSIVSCSSQNYRHSRCPISGAGQITSVFVQKKESKSACTRGSSYGVEGGSIWVNRGCRARFFVCPKLGEKCISHGHRREVQNTISLRKWLQ